MARKEQRIEAIERMKLLGIYAPTVRRYRDSNIISESIPPLGACYDLDKEQMQRVLEFEESHNALVYHVIHSYTEFGEFEDFLFVSQYDEEWDLEKEDIKDGYIFSYANNLKRPDCSEMGTIGYAHTPAGGLVRVW